MRRVFPDYLSVSYDHVANKWFKTYLCNRKQYVSVIGFKFNLRTLTCRVLQGSVEFRFAHDANILHINKSPKMLNKLIKIWQTGLLSKELHKIFQKLN